MTRSTPGGATRRAVIKATLVAGGFSLATGMASADDKVAQQKIAQKVVQYQTTPKNNQQCDKCTNWTPPNACKIVDGEIVATGWCVAFAPKSA